MIENIIHNNGLTIAISGLCVVFGGLILISLVIQAFNRIFTRQKEPVEEVKRMSPAGETGAGKKIRWLSGKPIPEDHLMAIATAVELYRRLHFEKLETRITFRHGDMPSAWKAGTKFGQRTHGLR